MVEYTEVCYGMLRWGRVWDGFTNVLHIWPLTQLVDVVIGPTNLCVPKEDIKKKKKKILMTPVMRVARGYKNKLLRAVY